MHINKFKFSTLLLLMVFTLITGCNRVSLPVVITDAVASITSESLILNGIVQEDGGGEITLRGFKYSTVNPPFNGGIDIVNNGGVGAYSSTVTGLGPATTYYIQAYAVNEAGIGIGEVVSFTTLAVVPE